jgi:hypothetical protein
MSRPAPPRPAARSLHDDPVAFAFGLWSAIPGVEIPFEEEGEADYAAISALAAAVVQQAPETEPLLDRLLEQTLVFAGEHHHRGISFGVRAEAMRQTLRPDTPWTGKRP